MGSTIDLSIQAGLLTIFPGRLSNYSNLRVSFWFQFGWVILNILLLAVVYRQPRSLLGVV